MTTSHLTLHAFTLSGHAHRAELFLSILGLPFERVEVDLPKGAQKTEPFLSMNPLGQVPVLVDGELTIADSNAILVYLASRYDPSGAWYPRDAVTAARIQRWLSIAAGELATGPAAARMVKLFGAPLDHERARQIATRLYDMMERHLSSSTYLASDAPTIADVALYSYTSVAPEGHVSLEPWPNIRAWLERVRKIEGFIPMPESKVA